MHMIVRYGTALYLAAGIASTFWAGRSGDRIPVGVRFSGPLPALPKAHPDSNIMGSRVSFRGGVKPAGAWRCTPTAT